MWTDVRIALLCPIDKIFICETLEFFGRLVFFLIEYISDKGFELSVAHLLGGEFYL